VDPGAISVIPAAVGLGVDLRGISANSLQQLEAAIRGAVADVAGRRGIEASVRLLRGGEPVQLDAGLAGAALGAAERLQIPAGRTWSGAGHDAQHLGGRTPTLLLFVPLRGGESHTPAEGADPGDIDAATRVVAAVLSTVS
jgi:N-carbamoyl-L-amino-acid hydrolase